MRQEGAHLHGLVCEKRDFAELSELFISGCIFPKPILLNLCQSAGTEFTEGNEAQLPYLCYLCISKSFFETIAHHTELIVGVSVFK